MEVSEGNVLRVAQAHVETLEAIGDAKVEILDSRGSFAFDVVDAIEARLEARGSTIDAAYLVEIGVARLECGDVDGMLRRGDDVDAETVRRTLGRVDDLFRRLEGSIMKGADHAFRAAR